MLSAVVREFRERNCRRPVAANPARIEPATKPLAGKRFRRIAKTEGETKKAKRSKRGKNSRIFASFALFAFFASSLHSFERSPHCKGIPTSAFVFSFIGSAPAFSDRARCC